MQRGAALAEFKMPLRRMQYLGCWQGRHVYDDFAHHPTAMFAVLKACHKSMMHQSIWWWIVTVILAGEVCTMESVDHTF